MEKFTDIEALFIDVGNTMRIVVKDEPFQAKAKQQLAELIGTGEDPEVLCARLEERYRIYRKRAKVELVEASEQELWTQWLLPDLPYEMIAPLSGRLTRLWRDRDGRRVARPDVKSVVLELCKRGYRLGIIANTITETEIPDWLVEDGLVDCFEAVVLSSKTGTRKPGPEIYLDAAARLGVEPGRAMYLGDNPSRDVLGARLAGYGMVLILMEPATLAKEPPTTTDEPDRVLYEFRELLELFPPRDGRGNGS